VHFIIEALLILLVGFVLMRLAGKKTALEMTGLEIITLLAMASMIGHAVSNDGLLKSIIVLCALVSLLVFVQYMSVKFNIVEKLFMGTSTLVIQEGQLIPKNLKKLRMTVDQLEAKIREKGIASITDIKTGTIEMDGHLGYELMRHAKPVTIGELEKLIPHLILKSQQEIQLLNENLFDEVIHDKHQKTIPSELQ